MFKKRINTATNIRAKSENIASQEENDQDEESFLGNTVMEMKLEQSMRKKKLGTEFTSDVGANVSNKSEKRVKSNVQKSIESTLGSQFESKIDEGINSSIISHEKIMEKYIKERMGVQEISALSKSKHQTQEDELYKLPAEYKYSSITENPNDSTDDKNNGSGGDQFMSIGLAEVALPISFKFNNIEETEESRKKVEEERKSKYGKSGNKPKNLIPSGIAPIPATGTARFWNPNMSSYAQQQATDRIKAEKAEKNKVLVADDEDDDKNSNKNSGKNNDNTNKRKKFSNDDYLMNRFKQNERGRR